MIIPGKIYILKEDLHFFVLDLKYLHTKLREDKNYGPTTRMLKKETKLLCLSKSKWNYEFLCLDDNAKYCDDWKNDITYYSWIKTKFKKIE